LELINHDQTATDLHFGQALRSDVNYLASIRAQAPIDQSSVQLAAQLYPNRSSVCNWPDDALVYDQPS
jgi:non-homologous end joining protein Ku